MSFVSVFDISTSAYDNVSSYSKFTLSICRKVQFCAMSLFIAPVNLIGETSSVYLNWLRCTLKSQLTLATVLDAKILFVSDNILHVLLSVFQFLSCIMF